MKSKSQLACCFLETVWN